jgi:Uri superfamily endonuclease
MKNGIYCLIFRNRECTISVGSLNRLAFQRGWHIYVGSAQGPGGLSRVNRHIRLAALRDRRPHWHVDYLLVHQDFRLAYTLCAPCTGDFECRLAEAIGTGAVPGFGCSDCRCNSHLFYRPRLPTREVEVALSSLSSSCTIRKINMPRDKVRV